MAMPPYSVKEVIRRGYILKSEHPTYSQSARGTYMHAPHYDCSSFIGTINGVYSCPPTAYMKYVYPGYGFIYYPYFAVANSLKEGDILVWNQGDGLGNNGHTGLYLQNGNLLEMTGHGIIDFRSAHYRNNWEYVLRNPNAGIYITHWSPTDGKGGGF